MNSVLLLLLIVCGTYADLWDTDDSNDGASEIIIQGIRYTACTLSNDVAGACVPSRANCSTPNRGVGVIRFRASINPCPDDGVCCKVSDVIPTNTGTASSSATTTTSTTTTTTTTTTTSTAATPTINSRVKPPETAAECGFQKRQIVPSFSKTKQNEADLGEFPWAINLMILTSQAGQKGTFTHSGTGSLIHDRVVLSAAHVLNNKDITKLVAVIGDHDIKKRHLHKTGVRVSEIVMHSNFDSSDGNYNFGLVFLSSSAMTLPHVGTVCLPPPNYVSSTGASCAFSGWGSDTRNTQNQLTKTEVPMMTHSQCEQRLQQNPLLGPGFQLLSSLTCAGGELGKDICGGAGGSPLVCPIEGQQNRYVQTGIVTWVISCGTDGSPTVFADVAVARPWIDQQMAAHQYSTASYTY